MGKKAKSIAALFRVLASCNPLGSMGNQLRAEINEDKLNEKLAPLDDPIGTIHEDVPELSEIIYEQIQSETEHTTVSIQLDDEQYQKYSVALKRLESAGLLHRNVVLARTAPISLDKLSHTYIMYMANKFDDFTKLKLLSRDIKNCPSGKWLNGRELASEVQLPLPVVHACLKKHETDGHGIMSQSMNESRYMAS